MPRFASFAVGFAAGWLARGTIDSSRSAAVTVLATAMSAVDRVKRAIAIERDHLEDLVAEARARVEVLRAERAEREARGHDVQDDERFDEAAA